LLNLPPLSTNTSSRRRALTAAHVGSESQLSVDLRTARRSIAAQPSDKRRTNCVAFGKFDEISPADVGASALLNASNGASSSKIAFDEKKKIIIIKI
jgi:hypothetical protein